MIIRYAPNHTLHVLDDTNGPLYLGTPDREGGYGPSLLRARSKSSIDTESWIIIPCLDVSKQKHTWWDRREALPVYSLFPIFLNRGYNYVRFFMIALLYAPLHAYPFFAFYPLVSLCASDSMGFIFSVHFFYFFFFFFSLSFSFFFLF